MAPPARELSPCPAFVWLRVLSLASLEVTTASTFYLSLSRQNHLEKRRSKTGVGLERARCVPCDSAGSTASREGDQHNLAGFALQSVLQHGKISGAVGRGYHDLAVDDRGSGADVPGVVGDLFKAVV